MLNAANQDNTGLGFRFFFLRVWLHRLTLLNVNMMVIVSDVNMRSLLLALQAPPTSVILGTRLMVSSF